MLSELHKINITEIKDIDDLKLLNGDYINLEFLLPNSKNMKIFDDNKKYFAMEVCIKDCEKCYGVAIDEKQITILIPY